MIRLVQAAQKSEPLAQSALLTSVGSAGFAWLGVANEFLTAIATIVAIVSGVLAARFYYIRAKKLKDNESE